MGVLSLFDGISCARVALERLGIENITYYASEIDKYAIQIAQKNFPDTVQVGDITKLKGEDFPDIDLMIGGSPCQDLSIAKKNREGLKGQRSGLFYEFVRLLNEIKPKYFVLENVNSMPKEAKRQISEILGVMPVMINAALVSAQNRKRLFWVGKLVNGKYLTMDIPQPEDRGIFLKDIIEADFAGDNKSLTIGANYAKLNAQNFLTKRQGQMLYLNSNQIEKLKYLKGAKKEKREKNGHEYTFSEGALKLVQTDKSLPLLASGSNSIGRATNFIAPFALTERRTEEARRIRRESGHKIDPRRMKELQPRTDGKANPITTGQTKESLIVEKMGTLTEAIGRGGSSKEYLSMLNKMENLTGIIRKLTPVECERLQSLDDNYTEGVSNTQRYKALGNAFNVEVVKHILSFMK